MQKYQLRKEISVKERKCHFCGVDFMVKKPSDLGKYCSRNCFNKSQIGKKISKETIEKIVKSKIGKKLTGGFPETDITGQKFNRWTAIRFSHKNIRYTKSGKQSDIYWLFKCDCGTIRAVKKGTVVCKTGGSLSCGCLKKENRKKCFLGKNNPRWNGGISPFSSTVRALDSYKQWRIEVYKKDNYTCQMCGERGGHNLEVDHIKPFALILKENNIDTLEKAMGCFDLWNIENGRVLCKDCHSKTDTYKGRMFNILNKEKEYAKVSA